MAILDTIEAVKPDVSTIAIGLCASTATLLLVRAPSYAAVAQCCSTSMHYKHTAMLLLVGALASAAAQHMQGRPSW